MELTIDDDFKKLIPPLKKDEFEKLEKNILKDGIRDKLIVWDKTIIDGHNRYEIANKHKLDFDIKRLHFISKEEAINWMLNNQLGRRNLTPQQRVDVLFNADELIKSIYEKGKSKADKGRKKGRESRWNNGLSSVDEKPKPHNSVKEIAELAETSPATVSRMRKLKREDEESYKKVVDGEVGLYTAYNNLPTVNSATAEKDGFVKKRERGDSGVKDKTVDKPATNNNQQPPELTEEEIAKEMFDADVSNLFMHLNELYSEVYHMIAQLQSRFFDILAGKDTDLKVKRLVNLLDDVNRLKEHNPSGELNNFIKSIEMSMEAYRRAV